MQCELAKQGFEPGSCQVFDFSTGRRGKACEVTLRYKAGVPYRLIDSIILSRPEHYLSIYQSGCNFECKKCHAWRFTQNAVGEWMCPDDIAGAVERYMSSLEITFVKRGHATSWHAHELCRSCGSCVLSGVRGENCPGVLSRDKIMLSEQGWGPARNIVAFTGGDLLCQPDFYVRSAELIKERNERIWILMETNGYGLTPANLDRYQQAGIDSFWLDIKAFDDEVHRRLTGVSNNRILKLPAELKDRGFVLEVSSLFIPRWVETSQIASIARTIASVDADIPFTILAFFPEYRMQDVPVPNLGEMIEAYNAARDAGLRRVKLGNLHLFVHTRAEYALLKEQIGLQGI